MDYDRIGCKAIGSRLRTLSQTFTTDAERLYSLYGVALKPTWFPVFYQISIESEAQSITAIARAIGQSHPSVIKIAREMTHEGLISEHRDAHDGRKKILQLTQKGHEVHSKIQNQYIDVECAVLDLLSESRHNLWSAIQEVEYLLADRSLYDRVLAKKKARESASIMIVDASEVHFEAFRDLNEAWIRQYFVMEDADRRSLHDPQGYILDRGGHILVALDGDIVLGVCALIQMDQDDYDYELAKMAVAPDAQGRGIGYLLGLAILERAATLSAQTVYLESNTVLTPAISLYRKLGFTKIVGRHTPYERCNIQMEYVIDPR